MDDDAGSLTDVAGIRVGHFTDSRRPTGCTVVLTERPMTAGVDVRGSAPGTRETDLLAPLNTVTVIDAVLLSGGSAFGLDAAAGVVRYLEERGRGYQTGVGPVPIVPAAILFDLSIGDPGIRPDAEAGYRACLHAGTGPVEEGNVGAGAGATVGKLLGMEHAMKGGIGSASLRIGGLVVAALAVVNCIGDVRHPETGQILAGCRDRKGSGFADLRRVLRSRNISAPDMAGRNTTLVVAATNARFEKTGMTKIAGMCHDGFARAIHPVHLPHDGDTAFALSSGETDEFSLTQVGSLAADVTALAIARAVLKARSIPGFPAHL
ncbi:MAG: P1 family peptidase [Acidobacteriota bacterium]